MKTAYLSLIRDIVGNTKHTDDEEIYQIARFLNNNIFIKGTLFSTYELAKKDQLRTLDVLQSGILFVDVEEYNKTLTKEILETYVMEQADNVIGTIHPEE